MNTLVSQWRTEMRYGVFVGELGRQPERYAREVVFRCLVSIVLGLMLGCGCSDGSGRADMGSVAEDDRGGIAALRAENEALRRENQMLRRELISKNGALPDSVMPEKGVAADGGMEPADKETGYWLSSKTKVRHNKRCRNYRRVKGQPCGPKDGRPCKACGG